MRRFASLAAIAAALALPAWAQPSDCFLDYRVQVAPGIGEPRIEVRMRLMGSPRGETRLRLSREWGGVSDFHRGIRRFSGEDGGAPGEWIAKHPVAEPIELRYELVNARAGMDRDAPLAPGDFYRNAIGRTFFQLFGHGTFLVPDHLIEGRPIRVCVEVTGLPSTWTFATNNLPSERGGTRRWTFVATRAQLAATLLIAGDFRILRRDVAGRVLDVAIRGDWKFSDSAFADATARVVEAQRRFWNDLDFPHFLIALIPNNLDSGSSGGTGLDNAFALHGSRDFSVPGPAFNFLIAHEHLHTWIPHRLGTMGPDEAARYWFSEGFTNYLSHRLLLRTGLWKLEDYAQALNRTLEVYFNSPVREAPNSHIVANFWKDGAAQALPYQRGELFALHLAHRLAGAGHSLDAQLRGLRLGASQLAREGSSGASDLAVSRLRAALRPLLGASLDEDIEAHIEAGRTVPIDAGFLGPCFHGEWVEKPRFELGFDRDRTFGEKRVAGVVPGSAAERAGLRDGMAIERLSVYFGDLERDATVQVREADGTVREIKYKPLAATPVKVPQFRVKEGSAHDRACRDWQPAG